MEPKRETWWFHRRAGSRQVAQPPSPTALKGARLKGSGIGVGTLAGPQRAVSRNVIERATWNSSPSLKQKILPLMETNSREAIYRDAIQGPYSASIEADRFPLRPPKELARMRILISADSN